MLLQLDTLGKKIAFAIFAVVLVAVILYLFWLGFNGYGNNEPEQIFCAQDVQLCSDGSYVSRVAPACGFAECPAINNEPGWKTFTDATSSISLQYPETFPTKYMNALDWPPQANVFSEQFSCLEAGSETAPAGKTALHMVNGRQYCVTTETQGAAGSIYTQYAYAFLKGGKVVFLTFSVRAVQCGNYPDQRKTECEAERASFSVDNLIDRVAQTFRFLM